MTAREPGTPLAEGGGQSAAQLDASRATGPAPGAPAANGGEPPAEPPPASTAQGAESSAWKPLRQPVFRALWVASAASSLGTWMQNVGATWLMASLTPSPLLVALMQTATSLPVFLVGLPAGALADIVDRRRLLLLTQATMLLAAGLLGGLTLAGLATPWVLLGLTFALGLGGAMNSPAWQATTPELVPREDLPAAVALSSVSFNLARAVGPALGGAVVSAAGPGVCFLLNAVSYLGVLAVVARWRRPRRRSGLPAERVVAAVRTGVRYVHFAPALRGVLVRTGVFIIGASALWALLPLVARDALRLGSLGYGVLLGCLGGGAVAGALLLPAARRRLSPDALVGVATGLFALATLALALVRTVPLLGVALAAGGVGWIGFTSSVTVVAQTAVAPWVRARALGAYMLVFQGGLAGGSLAWGVAAARLGEPIALLAATATLVVGLGATVRWPLTTERDPDVRPAPAQSAPETALALAPEAGPILVTADYDVPPEQAPAFVRAMHRVGLVRQRNGAMRWGLYRDPTDPRHFLETFVSESWAEYLRQGERLTAADRALEEQARTFHQSDGRPPVVAHFIHTLEDDAATPGRSPAPLAPGA